MVDGQCCYKKDNEKFASVCVFSAFQDSKLCVRPNEVLEGQVRSSDWQI
jgi:hypothetical protein